MIDKLKKALKEQLIQKQNNIYLDKLDEQTTLYDDWIKLVEKKEDSSLHDELPYKSIIVIPYSACGYFFDLSETKEEIIIFTSDKDALASQTVNLIAKAFLQDEKCELIYGDEDEWNSNRTVRMNPWFKPDWSPDLLQSYFYFGNAFAIRVSALRDIKWIKSEDYMTNLYDFCLKATIGKTSLQIKHICHILYHSNNLKTLCVEHCYDVIREDACRLINEYYRRKELPFVSIIIPSRDHPGLIKNLLSSIYQRTTGVDFEIIIVDNGSNETNKNKIEELKNEYNFQYFYEPEPFNFAKMCNFGAKRATGNYLLFLNDDIEIRSKNWLTCLLEKSMLSYVGAVGAKLYYPESKVIQHAGITNLRLGPVHKLQFKEDIRSYYFDRNKVSLNVLAVTGACLMVAKDIFFEVNGFNEEFEVAFNDVDLCFRLYEAGYQNVIRNDIHLWHYESFSRGQDEDKDKQERLKKERTKLYEKHPKLYAKDPYYHPYLCNDILDTNFSYAYQYESGRNAIQSVPIKYTKNLKNKWVNECLIVSMEYAGDLEEWIEACAKDGKGIYIQGYSFVTGSDNACYKRDILLLNEESGLIYAVPCNDIYRPDLEVNLNNEKNTLLCGFSVMFDKESIKEGEYRVGVLASDKCGRQKLYNFTGKYLKV